MNKILLAATFMVLSGSAYPAKRYNDYTHSSPSKEQRTQQLTPPQFPGGNDGLYSYMMGQLKWPSGKYREATLLITFYVEKDGSLSNIVVEQSISADFDAKAVDLLKKSPKWIPAKKDGLPIKSKYRLPIRYHVDKELIIRKDTVINN